MEDISAASEQLATSYTDEAKSVETSMNHSKNGNLAIKNLQEGTESTNKTLNTVASIVNQVGEYAGKGFSVVASEIKKLSEQTSSATSSIKTNIKNIQEVSTKAINSVRDISTIAKDQSQYINDTIRLFTSLIDSLGIINNNIHTIVTL